VKRRNKGMILVISLWAVAIMAVIAIAVCGTVYMSQGQLRAVRTVNCNELATQSAISAVCTQLLADTSGATTASNFPLTINDVEVTLRDSTIQDESARLNANTVTVEMFAKLNGMNESAAKKFVAAREKLAELRSDSKDEKKANWPIADLPELAKILTDATSLKYAANSYTTADDADWYNAVGVCSEVAAIMKNLTVYSRQKNTDSSGQARVNINLAAADTLTQRLGDVLTSEQITAMVQSRAQNPFTNIVELLTRQYEPVIDEKTVTVRIDEDAFRKIADRVTVTDKTVLLGLVDVSSASQDVLRTLPGLSENDVTAITSWQQFKASPTDLAQNGIASLLDVLSADTLAAIAPYITTRNHQYRCVFIKNYAGNLEQYTACVIEKSDRNFGTIFRYDWSVFASVGDNR